MSIEFLDPSNETEPTAFAPAGRLASLRGTTVGLLSNGKEGTRGFFDALEQTLLDEHGVGEVIRVTKGNYSAPAEAEIMQQARSWDALIAGIGD
jgi:hypothetical protein